MGIPLVNVRNTSALDQLLEQICAQNGERCAVLFEELELSYTQLESLAQKYCDHLLSLDLSQSEVIAVCVGRSPEMIALLYGILKAGLAYLPLDLDYPMARLEYMIVDSGSQIIIVDESTQGLFENQSANLAESNCQFLSINDLLQVKLLASNERQRKSGSLAYIIYTSGTTGNPKGVAVGHQQVLCLIDWAQRETRLEQSSRTLQFAPLSFDPSVMEIFSTLASGKTLVLVDALARKDPQCLLDLIMEKRVDRFFITLPILHNLAQEAIERGVFPSFVQEITCGGDVLKIDEVIVSFFKQMPNTAFNNQYGPTEATVATTNYRLKGSPERWPELPPIGHPIGDTQIHILSPELQPLAVGEIGEVALSGPMLAQGYWKRAQLTASKFLNIMVNGQSVRVYRTGDLGVLSNEGMLYFKGRIDEQVKVNGVRVEIAELESQILSIAGVKEVAVKLVSANVGNALAAFFVGNISEKELRELLISLLPAQIVPASVVKMNALPLSANGKVDKKKLSSSLAEIGQSKIAKSDLPTYALESLYAEALGHRDFTVDQTFFAAGGTSLQAIALVRKLRKVLEREISLAQFFENSSLNGLNRLLEGEKRGELHNVVQITQKAEVAIIGLACRYPGAPDLESYWELLKNNREGISFFRPEELDSSIDPEEIKDVRYVRARGVLEGVELFDAAYFGFNPRVAELMDPQMRIMLEESVHALEHAAIIPGSVSGKVGVFYGMSNNSYYPRNIVCHPDKIKALGDWTVSTLNEKDYIATHVAYKLGLKGPALSIHTACSTSLVAIIEAYKAIERGDCTIALAGGINVEAQRKSGHLYQEGGIRSLDGHCRSFDKEASGTVFSDGVGVVVLKDLKQALRDGDHIQAVIKGVATNNDGGQKMSFIAPSLEGQRDVIEMALANADVDPATIEMIECHGTATPIGDPIEVEAIKSAYGLGESLDDKKIYLGSVKSNIGHTVTAAGVAGVIKSVLALKNKLIPSTLHFKELNQEIDLRNTPFVIAAQNESWQANADHPRRAGVSAFGVGGTNAHLILEEYKAIEETEELSERSELFVFSAKSERSLQKLINNWITFISNNQTRSLRSLAKSLVKGRAQFEFRAAVVASTHAELKSELESLQNVEFKRINKKGAIVFALPGQGVQYLRMGQLLYQNLSVFKECCDNLFESLAGGPHSDLKRVIFNDEALLSDTFYTQPAIYIFEVAMGRTLIDLGVCPEMLIAHSVGEFSAAALSGVMSDAQGLDMICARARLMRELPGGRMLSVRASRSCLEQLLLELQLVGQVQVAAENAPELCVLAGNFSVMNELEQELQKRNLASKALVTSHAFHSPMMNPVVSEFKKEFSHFSFETPKLTIYSTLEGSRLQSSMDADYFALHAQGTVELVRAFTALLQDSPNELTLIDLGPRQIMSTMAKQISRSHARSLHSICLNNETDEWKGLLLGLGKLWTAGHRIDLGKLIGAEVMTCQIPLYPFDRKRYWLENLSSTSRKLTESNDDKRGTAVNTQDLLILELQKIFADSSGFAQSEVDPQLNFLELGLDSLLLTQVAIELEKAFALKISFRQLMDELPNLKALATYLRKHMSATTASRFEAKSPESIVPAVEASPTIAEAQRAQPQEVTPQAQSPLALTSSNALEAIVLKQLELMNAQMQLLSGVSPSVTSVTTTAPKSAQTPVALPIAEQVSAPKVEITEEQEVKATVDTAKIAFGAQARISTQASVLEAGKLQSSLQNVMGRYISKTIKSKEFTQKYRAVNADPRVVTGFRPEIKEMVYPVVVNRSKDQHLWDIDGNEYIDMTCGFGSNFFGNQNPRITKALHDQIDRGFEIGPQHELVGECAELICEFSGLERAAFCNTGSEAVLGALRVSRTATGRKKIIMFKGSYHGINDEVIVRGLAGGKAMPAAAGINRSSVSDIMVLDYGTDESLEIIRANISDVAAVICEPVQSRRANFRPREFLQAVRDITSESGAALIFDEVITGFRIAPGGAQEYFGIKADIATYGKIVGGGMPIGVIAGTKKFMDALDGGFWDYGDDSTPNAALTYFAGTFVRHPLALRAMREALLILKEGGRKLYSDLNERSSEFVRELNLFCSVMGAPIEIDHFGGVLKPRATDSGAYNDMFYALMRLNGIHVYDGFPWFITLAHTEADLQQVISTFKKCVIEMQELGLFEKGPTQISSDGEFLIPPMPEAKLGLDETGMPAWFVPDAQHPGGLKKV